MKARYALNVQNDRRKNVRSESEDETVAGKTHKTPILKATISNHHLRTVIFVTATWNKFLCARSLYMASFTHAVVEQVL